MVGELRSRYRREPSVAEGRRVTPDRAGNWFLPAISLRGWYLYRQTLDDSPAIVLLDPAHGTETTLVVTVLTDSASLTATQDGERIAFATYRVTEGASGEIVASDVYSLDPDTRRVRRITTGARAWQPRYSPDGSRLLAVSAAGPWSRLVEIDRNDGSMKLLFSKRGAIVSAPTVSPDGGRVAFTVEENGRASIRVLPLPSPEQPISAEDPVSDFNIERAQLVVGPSSDGAWYPQFIDNSHLLFSSVTGEKLALWSADLHGTHRRLRCEDPVGAWSGILLGNDVLYATLRANGYALMLKPSERVPQGDSSSEASPSSSDPTAAADPDRGRAAAAGLPYHDVPRFLGWTPIPIYYSTIAPQALVAAPGAILFGESNLQTSSFFGSISFRTDVLQPALEASLQTTFGHVGAFYSLSEGYASLSSTDHREEIVQEAGVSVPVVFSTELLRSTTLSLFFSLTDSLSARSSGNFAVVQGLDGSAPFGITDSHDLDVTAGVNYRILQQGSPKDLFPRREWVTSASLSTYPPLVSSSGPGEVAVVAASVSLPSPFPHQVIKLGAKSSYFGLGGTFYQLVNPRGAFDPLVQSLPGRSLVSVEYQTPIALLDAPLGYSLGLIGVGSSFHLEAAGDWKAFPATLQPDEDVYAGAEIVLDIAVGESFFPIGLGVAVKFDPRLVKPLNGETDVRPYVFISNDSFTDSSLRAPRVEEAFRR